MIIDSLLAYLHFIAVFLFFAFLTVEAMLLRQDADARSVALLARTDLWLGPSAVLVVLTGIARVMFGAKGSAFYVDNPVFWAKVALFAAVGVMSIRPGRTIRGWARSLQGDAQFVPDDVQRLAVRRWVMTELHLAALLPLSAVLMARGVGYL